MCSYYNDTEVKDEDIDKMEEHFMVFIRKRLRVKYLLLAEADELEKHLRNAKIVKLTGAPLGIIGTGLGIAGFVSGFFTLGAGFSLCIAGAAVAGAGGALGVGGNITTFVATKCSVSEAKRLLEEDRRATERLKRELNKWSNLASAAGGVVSTFGKGWSIYTNSMRIANAACNVMDDVACTAFRSLSNTARVFQAIGVAVSVVFLPADIYTIVTHSQDIHKNKIPQTVTYLREVAEQITIPDENELKEKFRRLKNRSSYYYL